MRYPDILATGGLSDPRVGFWEPAKWVANFGRPIRKTGCCSRPSWAPATADPPGGYDAWRDEAFVYAFILDALGLTEESSSS